MPWWVTGDWIANHTIACWAGRQPLCRLGEERWWTPQHWYWRTYRHEALCHWEPVSKRRRHYDSPPRWFVNHRWSAPDRMAARVACDRARAEHRAGYEPESEPPVRQHRQGARWDWS